MESLFLSLVLMQPITPCSFPKLRSNIPCADCYLISINNQHYFLLIYLYLMTMKTSYRKIYLFLLLLTSYSCNDLTETNMSIDIISMTKYNNIINIDSSVSVSAILSCRPFFILIFLPYIKMNHYGFSRKSIWKNLETFP